MADSPDGGSERRRDVREGRGGERVVDPYRFGWRRLVGGREQTRSSSFLFVSVGGFFVFFSPPFSLSFRKCFG